MDIKEIEAKFNQLIHYSVLEGNDPLEIIQLRDIVTETLTQSSFNLEHRLTRLKLREQELVSKYVGKEQDYTFHAGYDLGYLQGTIAEIENSNDVKEYTCNSECGLRARYPISCKDRDCEHIKEAQDV